MLENKKQSVKIGILLILGILTTIILPRPVFSQNSTNNFNIRIQRINETVPQPEPTTTPVPTIQSGEKNNKTDSQKEKIIADISTLYFSISESLIDFGPLSPTNPVSRNLNLLVSFPGTYQILTQEDNPLRNLKNETIPDTACDNGACDENTVSEWINNLTYGFGLRCVDADQQVCLKDFSFGNDYYKTPADASKNEAPTPVIHSGGSLSEEEAQIIFKINTSGTQSTGSYLNTVTLIAVPGY